MRLEKKLGFAPGHNQRLKSCEGFWNRSSCLAEKDPYIVHPLHVSYLRHFKKCHRCREGFRFLGMILKSIGG